MKRITLNHGRKAQVSDEYYDDLDSMQWSYSLTSGYAVKTIDRKTISMHVYIAILEWRVIPDGYEVDHINKDRLDNRIENLRIVTRSENRQNRGPAKNKQSCPYKGVSFRKDLKSRPWFAQLQADGETYHLGYFASAEEAALAYNEASRRLHKYGYINEIPENLEGEEI